MEHKSLKETLIDGMGRIVNELARYRRMVELDPDTHEMTVEEFDTILNKQCDEAHKKYGEMTIADVVIDTLMTKLEIEKAYKEKRS